MDIEKVKQFWDSRPCNIRHSQKEIGTLDFYDEVTTRRYRVEPHIVDFAQFNQSSGKRILEIGCGIGTDSISFVQNGGILTAVDLSSESLEICRKRFLTYGLPIRLVCGNAENLSLLLPTEKFDIIYSFGVIHHTPRPDLILEEIKKFSDCNTEIKLMFYSKYSWKAFSFFLKSGWRFRFNFRKTIKYFAEAQLGCPIAEVYSEQELRGLLKDFNILSMEKCHIFPYKISDYIKGDLNKKLIFKYMPSFLYKILSRLLGWHWLVTMKIK